MEPGFTRFNPDGTTTWVTGAMITDEWTQVSALLEPFAVRRARTSKAQRRRAKARLADHRAWLRAEVDLLNPWGTLKREYTGTTGVAAMAREMETCGGGMWCPPFKWVRLRM